MRERDLRWPSYLAILIGVTAGGELLFDIFGLNDASLGGVIFLVVLWIIWDFFADDLPGMKKEPEEKG